MNDTQRGVTLSSPIGMFLSAAIFGFFGFLYINWNPHGISGQFLPFVAICEWTLKCAAIGFAVCGAVTIAHAILGNLLFGVFGLVTSALFVVIAALDFLDKQHTIMPYAPFILLLFAAWNGYGSWTSLKSIRSARRSSPETGYPASDR